MKVGSAIGVLLRAIGHAGPSSRRRSRAAVGEAWSVAGNGYPQLHRAVFCHLLEVGDSVERGDQEAARKAMAMAAAIEGELWSGEGREPRLSDRTDDGSLDGR